jgi:uncharacterized protein (TIGR03000 family)
VNVSPYPPAACVLLLALAAPSVAQNPYSPTPPYNPAPASPSDASQDRSLTTAPAASDPAAQYGPLYHLLHRIQLPHASGEVREPPTDAAVVVVRVPDAAAEVLFDDEPTGTAGKTRYFVTSHLDGSQKEKYTVSVRWKQGGDGMKREREVEVTAGQWAIVDFTRAEGK